MLRIKKDEVPDYEFRKAVKKPIAIRCIQMNEPFEVESLEGVVRGKAGDYLMVGVRGEMYICDKEIFDETYELKE